MEHLLRLIPFNFRTNIEEKFTDTVHATGREPSFDLLMNIAGKYRRIIDEALAYQYARKKGVNARVSAVNSSKSHQKAHSDSESESDSDSDEEKNERQEKVDRNERKGGNDRHERSQGGTRGGGRTQGGYNNCLLYTSPSPRDLSTSRMPSSA